MANEKNVENFNSKSTFPKKLFTPFQGIGHKLGGSSDDYNTLPIHKRENSRNKVAISSSSSEKASDIKPLSNIRKIPRLSNSQENLSKGNYNIFIVLFYVFSLLIIFHMHSNLYFCY